ncbi:MAG: hypothetical protein AAFW46_13340 [Pseudomonadota bacterium]
MWTYSTINLVVTLGVFGAGLVGFAAGWLAHRAAVKERGDAETEY